MSSASQERKMSTYFQFVEVLPVLVDKFYDRLTHGGWD